LVSAKNILVSALIVHVKPGFASSMRMFMRNVTHM